MVIITYNVGNHHHDIVEWNSGKANISFWLYISSLHQEPKHLVNINGANINFGNILGKLFHGELVLPQWKANIEGGLFL